jgi:hypothetical protein
MSTKNKTKQDGAPRPIRTKGINFIFEPKTFVKTDTLISPNFKDSAHFVPGSSGVTLRGNVNAFSGKFD